MPRRIYPEAVAERIYESVAGSQRQRRRVRCRRLLDEFGFKNRTAAQSAYLTSLLKEHGVVVTPPPISAGREDWLDLTLAADSETQPPSPEPSASRPGEDRSSAPISASYPQTSTGLVRSQTPEEHELQRKLAELTALEATLAERELELATIEAELHAFEQRYLTIVGLRYAELDEIEARIAEALAKLEPQDPDLRSRANQTRDEARRTAEEAGAARGSPADPPFVPTEELKSLYRQVAKAVHPDLAPEESQRGRRVGLMARVNRAYEAGDGAELRAILREWEESAESVGGDGVGAELVRVIRRLSAVQQRLQAIADEIGQLRASELSQLREQARDAQSQGRDPLLEMAAEIDMQIARARERLRNVAEDRVRA